MARLLQINLNRAWRAEDLMTQMVAECESVVCIISEPLGVPDSPQWLASEDKLAAIYIGKIVNPGFVTLFQRGMRYVAVNMSKTLLISCYVSPNWQP